MLAAEICLRVIFGENHTVTNMAPTCHQNKSPSDAFQMRDHCISMTESKYLKPEPNLCSENCSLNCSVLNFAGKDFNHDLNHCQNNRPKMVKLTKIPEKWLVQVNISEILDF